MGFKFESTIAETAVPKFKQGVITSLPLGRFKTLKASVSADDPEFTIRPYFF